MTLPVDRKDTKYNDRLDKYLDGLEKNQRNMHAAILSMASILQEQLAMRPQFEEIYRDILVPKINLEKMNTELEGDAPQQKIYVSQDYFDGIYSIMKREQDEKYQITLDKSNELL